MNMQSFNTMILWSTTCVDPQILKYAALPAAVVAVGLSSFRIYSINEELISPREVRKIMFGMVYIPYNKYCFCSVCNLLISCMHGIPE